MKKIFTLIVACASALVANAKDYPGNLTVTMGAEVVKQTATISIEQGADSKYTLTLKNFCLGDVSNGGIAVGNVVIDGVEGTTDSGNLVKLEADKNVVLQDGDDKSISWNAASVNAMCGGSVPVKMTAYLDNNDENKFVTAITIALNSMLGYDVAVDFGATLNGYQIKNSDFEAFHTESLGGVTGVEPDYWHSFLTSGGKMASYASITGVHTFASEAVTRPGTSGKKSALIVSNGFTKIIANGTITTGRLNAGSATPTDPSNYSYTDSTETAKDSQDNPFYSVINAMPDSLKLWVKFKQGGGTVADYPYATVNAVLTDGTRFQDPEDKTYTNVFGQAQNNKIESNGYEWQEITIPFDYSRATAYTGSQNDPKEIYTHITISTNASAGKGTLTDTLYVDDLSLVYNAGLKSATFKGKAVNIRADHTASISNSGEFGLDDLDLEPDGVGAYTSTYIKSEYDEEWGDTANSYIIQVISADWQKITNYEFTVNGGWTGIEITKAEDADANSTAIKAIYTVNGVQVSDMSTPGVYIIKRANGTTTKVSVK